MNKCPFCKKKNCLYYHVDVGNNIEPYNSCSKCGKKWREEVVKVKIVEMKE